MEQRSHASMAPLICPVESRARRNRMWSPARSRYVKKRMSPRPKSLVSMLMDGFALTGVNSGVLAFADIDTATATKPAAAIKTPVRPRRFRIEEAIFLKPRHRRVWANFKWKAMAQSAASNTMIESNGRGFFWCFRTNGPRPKYSCWATSYEQFDACVQDTGWRSPNQ